MRNVIILIIFVSLISFISCNRGKLEYAIMELSNRSTHDIVISCYEKENKRLVNTITLSMKSSIQSERFITSGDGGQSPLPNILLDGDSVVIEYSNLKRHIFHFPLSEIQIGSFDFNILEIGNYVKQAVSQTEHNFVFTFSDDHFDDAHSID